MRRHLFLILFLCVFFSLYAQNKENSKFSIDTKFNISAGLGNKFFKDSFKASPGFSLGFNFKFNQKFGLFLEVKNQYLEIKNPEIFGQFSKVNFSNYNFGGKYIYELNDKINFEGKLFIGNYNINGYVNGSKSSYTQNGTIYGTGINTLYLIDKSGTVNIIVGFDLERMVSDIKIDNPFYQDYYNKSTIIIPNFGVRFNF